LTIACDSVKVMRAALLCLIGDAGGAQYAGLTMLSPFLEHPRKYV